MPVCAEEQVGLELPFVPKCPMTTPPKSLCVRSFLGSSERFMSSLLSVARRCLNTNVLNHDAHSAVLQADAARRPGGRMARRRLALSGGARLASSEVAACIAGEAGSFLYPVIHHNLRRQSSSPLRADSFMVLSTTWTLTGNDPGQH